MVLRSRVLAILLISACILSGVAASASPVAVHYREGFIHGFLVLSTLDGVVIAAGDLTQVARGDQVTTQVAFRFKDGSRQEETTVFSQRGNFRLISYHLVQKGPSFKNASDLSVAVRHWAGHGSLYRRRWQRESSERALRATARS